MKRRYLYDSSSALHIACYSSRDAESRERERERIFQAPLRMICTQDEGGATLAGSLILKFGHILLYTALSSPQ